MSSEQDPDAPRRGHEVYDLVGALDYVGHLGDRFSRPPTDTGLPRWTSIAALKAIAGNVGSEYRGELAFDVIGTHSFR